MNFFFSSRRRHTFFFQAEDGIRDRSPSRGLGDVYKRQTPLLPPRIYSKLGPNATTLNLNSPSSLLTNLLGPISNALSPRASSPPTSPRQIGPFLLPSSSHSFPFTTTNVTKWSSTLSSAAGAAVSPCCAEALWAASRAGELYNNSARSFGARGVASFSSLPSVESGSTGCLLAYTSDLVSLPPPRNKV